MLDLSFIIPMYNAERYIEKCVDSILHQGMEKDSYEIIVIDDGSDDNGSILLKQYSEVKLYSQPNQGQSAARNSGIEKAQGEYICFVDADDFLLPDRIGQCLEFAKRSNLNMLTYGMVRCNADCTPLQPIHSSDEVSYYESGIKYLEENNYNNGPCWYLVKKEALCGLRFVTGHFGEDGMFTMELLMQMKKMAKINMTCYCYVERSGSTTTRRDQAHLAKMVNDYLFVYKYMQNLIVKYRPSLSEAAVKRCDERSKTYIFYLMVRVMRFSTSSRQIDNLIQLLRSNGISSVPCPNRMDYHGIKYPIITYILNHAILMKIVNRMLNLHNLYYE